MRKDQYLVRNVALPCVYVLLVSLSFLPGINGCPDKLSAIDEDRDGFGMDVDCNPDDPDVNPGATEDLTDGIDNNCDDLVDCLQVGDCDRDFVPSELDCDDHDAEKKARQSEICNGVDDDCNKIVDDEVTDDGKPCILLGIAGECAKDAVQACDAGILECKQTRMPAVETCDGRDNDCDGTTDEGCACVPGQTMPCGSWNVGACKLGQLQCVGGEWGDCMGRVDPVLENCSNGIDDNCNGIDDDDDPDCVSYVDLPDLQVFPLVKSSAGDIGFNAHGPDVNLRIDLTRTATTIEITATVQMTETIPDCTMGIKTIKESVPVLNTAILSDTHFELNYRDTDWGWDDAIMRAQTPPLNNNGCGAPRGGGFYQQADFVEGVLCAAETDGVDICSDVAPPFSDCSACMLHLGYAKIRTQ